MAQTNVLMRQTRIRPGVRRQVRTRPRAPLVPSLTPTLHVVEAPPRVKLVGVSHVLPHRPTLPRSFAPPRPARPAIAPDVFQAARLRSVRTGGRVDLPGATFYFYKGMVFPKTLAMSDAGMPLDGLGDLGKISFKKIRRKIGAYVAGAATLGLVPPKALGIKSKSGRRMFRVGRGVGIAAAVIVTATFAGPTVLAQIGPYASKLGPAMKSFAPKALAKLGPQILAHATGLMTQQGVSEPDALAALERESGNIVEADTAMQAVKATQAGAFAIDTNTLMLFGVASAIGFVVFYVVPQRRR